MINKGNSPQAESLTVAAPSELSELVTKLMVRLDDMQKVMESRLETEFGQMRDQVGQVMRQVEDLDVRVERQGMRLASMETFPLPPIMRPPQWQATDVHSATSAKRVRAGYSG